MKAPQAPDPRQTAAAQTQMNKDTAVTQFGLNAVNQNTPQGSLSYNQIGTWDDGTPRYEANTQYSPEQQNLYNQQNQLSSGVNNLALNQVGRLDTLLGTPVDMSNEATESRLMELGRKRLDPMFADRRQGLETDLLNRGINMGTEAYDKAVGRFGEQENDAYNQLLLGGRQQAISEMLAGRNQPINEITALMSGGQVTQPNFVNTPNTPVSGVDYAGLVGQDYQNKLKAHQAQMGGIFGLGGTALRYGLGGWGAAA